MTVELTKVNEDLKKTSDENIEYKKEIESLKQRLNSAQEAAGNEFATLRDKMKENEARIAKEKEELEAAFQKKIDLAAEMFRLEIESLKKKM